MYLNIVYAHMLHCMIKLRLDLESTHQASHFGIWFVQIGQIEVDINQFNILELGHTYLRIRDSVAYCITSSLDFNKRGCVRQI